MFRNERVRGITVVELLVMLAVTGVLIALLIPAVQSARETARRVDCQNHLKQLSLGCLSHESSLHYFPSGGWGGNWIGDSDYGFGRRQPGGWGFNILPFIEQKSIYNSSRGILKMKTQIDEWPALKIPIAVFNCPTRRAPIAYPWKQKDPENPRILFAFRSDYAINAGSEITIPVIIPISRNVDPATVVLPPSPIMNGVSYQLSEVSIKEIIGGTSRTYLVGEKYLDPNDYTTMSLENVLYAGFDESNFRTGQSPPYRDRRGYRPEWAFGSAHASVWNMSFCDGSVHAIGYNIDPNVHKYRSNRANKIPF